MMEGIIGRYKAFLILGMIIVLVSFGVGAYRTANQATLSQLEFAGDSTSSAYSGALITEAVLMRYSEIVPLLGLGFIKLGIGFAIATIVIHLRATGQRAGASLRKAGQEIVEIKPSFFARNFPRFLVLGIAIELVATAVMVGWILTGLRVIGLQFAGETASSGFLQIMILDKTLEALAEPIEGLGVTFLIGGISFGLAMIVANLGIQATQLPETLLALKSGGEGSGIVESRRLIPKKLMGLTALGMIITASAFPIALFRAMNESTLQTLEFAGASSSLVYQTALVTERLIAFTWETWMFVGIAIMLFSIGFWLLTIVDRLRAQRSNLGAAAGRMTGLSIPAIELPMRITKVVPFFLVAGLLWMLIFFGVFNIMRDIAGLNVLSEQFAGRIGSELFQQSTIAQATLGELVRPGKAIGLALIFTGIGLSLLTIAINLRLTAMMLPGAFTKIVNAIRGVPSEEEQAVEKKEGLLALAPRGLFVGMLIGAAIIVTGTFPLALLRIANTEVFLMEMLAGRTESTAFQVGKQTQLMLEHFIGPWVAVGNGLIFYYIGRFFSTIVGFVQARRQIISEGVESAVSYYLEKEKGPSSS